MGDGPRDPFTVAQSLLAGVVAGFGGADVALPARQVVTAGGLPAWDTEQVTVSLQRVYAGMVGAEQGQATPWQHGMFTGTFLVQLVRQAKATLANAPRRKMPSVEDLAADGETFMRDARLLASALHTWKRGQQQGTVKVSPIVAPDQQGEMLGLSAFVDVLLA